MDDSEIVEAVARAIRDGSRCGDPDSPFPCPDCDRSFEGGNGCLLIAHAAIAAYEAALAKAGFVIVPREPTPEMLEAGKIADWVGDIESRAGLSIMPDEDWQGHKRPGIWRAMLAAAPKRGAD